MCLQPFAVSLCCCFSDSPFCFFPPPDCQPQCVVNTISVAFWCCSYKQQGRPQSPAICCRKLTPSRPKHNYCEMDRKERGKPWLCRCNTRQLPAQTTSEHFTKLESRKWLEWWRKKGWDHLCHCHTIYITIVLEMFLLWMSLWGLLQGLLCFHRSLKLMTCKCVWLLTSLKRLTGLFFFRYQILFANTTVFVLVFATCHLPTLSPFHVISSAGLSK